MNEPLAGVRVVDLTSTFMGPYCTMLMARMGADVIKVEAPGGDVVRHIGRGRSPGMGPIFLAANHGKRSLGLDLKADGASAVLHSLVETADVFVTNMRPSATERLGVAAKDLTADHPALVHCTLPGFGSDGPYRDRAAYDDVIQAGSGLAATQGGAGEPEYVRTVVADKTVALLALGAITTALFARERTGRGGAVEVPMFEAMVSFTLLEQQTGHVFTPPEGPTGYSRTASPHRRPYRTADGHLGVVVYTDRQWLSFFDLIERPELALEERFATITRRTENIDELYRLLGEVLRTRTTADWVSALDALGIPAQPILTPAEVMVDPHVQAVGLFERVDHPTEGPLALPRLPVVLDGTAAKPVAGAPRFGQHSTEVLREIGLDGERLDELVRRGVVLGPADPDPN